MGPVMTDQKQPDVAQAEWTIGWADGYRAFLRDEPSP